MTRRDMCHFIGKRAALLAPRQAAAAWQSLATDVEALGEVDVPKFLDLLRAIRRATIHGKQESRKP